MGLTLRQTNGDDCCERLFYAILCQGSCHPGDGISNRSRHAKLNPPEPVSDLLHHAMRTQLRPVVPQLPPGRARIPLWTQGEGSRWTCDTVPPGKADSAKRTLPSRFQPKVPVPPVLQQSPSPATTPPAAPRGSGTTQSLASLHFQAHDGKTRSSSEKEDEGTAGKADQWHPNLL